MFHKCYLAYGRVLVRRNWALRLYHWLESRCCYYGYTWPGYRRWEHTLCLWSLRCVAVLHSYGVLRFVETECGGAR